MAIQRDLSIGDAGEQLVITALNNKGYACTTNKDIRYDIEAIKGSKRITFEVKHDIYESRSGNVAIEVWNSKKNIPSGITATQADFWCHIFGGKIYVIPTQDLKSFIDKTTPKRIIERAGDDNATIYLYSSDDFADICELIDDAGCIS